MALTIRFVENIPRLVGIILVKAIDRIESPDSFGYLPSIRVALCSP